MPTLSPLRILIHGVDQYSKEFNKFTKKVGKLGAGVTKLGKTLTASLTLPLAGIGIAGIKMSNDINKAMANVGTLIPGERKKLEGYKEEVLKLAAATGTASTTIAEGLYETISAFGDSVDPIKKLDIATKGSIAGLSSVKEALSLISAVTKGYGDVSNEAAQKVSDLSFLTVKLGQTTFPDLAASIGTVVPLATTLGVKVEELFAGFATLTGVTGNASEVATQLSSALGGFIKPTTAMTKAAKKLGFESSVAMVKELGLFGALQKLGTAVGMDEIKLGQLLHRKEGLNAALTLLNKQSDTFVDKLGKMYKATGSTEKAFKEQSDGINKAGFAMNKFIERVKILGIRIGDKLAPKLLELLDRLDPTIDKLSNLSTESLGTAIKIGVFAAAIGPALLIVGKLTTAIAGLMTFIGGAGGLAGIAAVATGPIGMTVAAVAALTAAIIYFRKELAPIGDAIITPIVDTFKELFSILTYGTTDLSGFVNVLKQAVSFAAKLVAPIVKLGMKLLLLPLRVIARQFRFVLDVASLVAKGFNVVSNAVSFVIGWLSKLWASFVTGTTIGKFVKEIFDSVAEAISFVVDNIKDAWKYVSNFFEDIGVNLDVVSKKLSVATEAQTALHDEMMYGADSTQPIDNLFVDQSIMPADLNRKIEAESVVHLTVEGLPESAIVTAKGTKGGKVKSKPKGPILEGAL
jgi:TP901 family phage tail tape measure protein